MCLNTSAAVWNDLDQSGTVCISLQRSTSVWIHLHQSTTVCNDLDQSTTVYISLDPSTSVYNSLRRSRSVWNGLHQSASIYTSQQQSKSIYMYISLYWSVCTSIWTWNKVGLPSGFRLTLGGRVMVVLGRGSRGGGDPVGVGLTWGWGPWGSRGGGGIKRVQVVQVSSTMCTWPYHIWSGSSGFNFGPVPAFPFLSF